MLDPLTSMGIACNVIQVISFCGEAISLAKNMKTDGTPDPELSHYAVHISAASSRLKQYVNKSNVTPPTKEQAELQEIALQCLKISSEIQSKLARIGKRRVRLLKAGQFLFKKNEFNVLQNNLQKYQQTMQTHLLLNICNKSDATAAMQERQFQDLDDHLQHFVRACAEGQAEVRAFIDAQSKDITTAISAAAQVTQNRIQLEGSKTRDQVQVDGNETRELIATVQESAWAKQDRETRRHRLLKSLKDENMNTRRNQITVAHEKTFRWTFEEPDEETCRLVFNRLEEKPWQTFPKWLASNETLYWVSGKPGSGKSTLIKYLVNNFNTSELLSEWKPNCQIYSHFIWKSGTQFQSSIKGLLQSLLFQILDRNPTILDDVLDDRPQLSRLEYPGDWSNAALIDTVTKSVQSHAQGVCIFVDGLDEIKESPFDLVDLVNDLASISTVHGVKLCVSSRPEPVFRASFSRVPCLRLQDLTFGDMRTYAQDIIERKCQFTFDTGLTAAELSHQVAERAEGVFLWAALALKSLQRGAVNGDDPVTLKKRLDALPSELNDLYNDIFERMGDDRVTYRREAALLFNLYLLLRDVLPVLPWDGEVTVFHLAVAFEPRLREQLFQHGRKHPSSPFVASVNSFTQVLRSRCGGLLEIVHDEGSAPDVGIQILHRSAQEFLADSDLLTHDTTPLAERQYRVLQARILDQYSRMYDTDSVFEFSPLRAMPTFGLSVAEQHQILILMKEVHHRNGWGVFYETAAAIGFYGLCKSMLPAALKDSRAVQSYLLASAAAKFHNRDIMAIPDILEAGADPNFLVAAPHLRDQWERDAREILLFPIPALCFFLRLSYIGLPCPSPDDIEKMLARVIQSGLDLERRFLVLCHLDRLIVTPTSWLLEHRPLPVEGPPRNDDVICEVNVTFHILNFVAACVKRYRATAEAQWQQLWSRLTLGLPKRYCRPLIGFDGKHPHTAIECVSTTRGSPLALTAAKNKRAVPIGGPFDTHETFFSLGPEVPNITEWLVQQGYFLGDYGDFEGVSEKTAFEDMVEIYDRMDKKYRSKELTPPAQGQFYLGQENY